MARLAIDDEFETDLPWGDDAAILRNVCGHFSPVETGDGACRVETRPCERLNLHLSLG
jgi:hypothetical protein